MKQSNSALFILLVGGVLLLSACASTGHSVDKHAAAQANANYGLDLLGKGRDEDAKKKFKRALKYESQNNDANWGMALIYQRAQEPTKAQNYYSKILKHHPQPAMLNSYAVFLCEQGQADKALKYYKKAGEDNNNVEPSVAYVNAGLCLQRNDQVDKAYQFYKKAVAKDPEQATALAKLAQIEFDRGNHLNARAYIERADAIDQLNADLLLIAARNELALANDKLADAYLTRYNETGPSKKLTMRQLKRFKD